jgi:hypothetical protein
MWAASFSHKRVLPSMSVKRNVTVPDGRSASVAGCAIILGASNLAFDDGDHLDVLEVKTLII